MRRKEERINLFLEQFFDNFSDIGIKAINRFLIANRYLLNFSKVKTTNKGLIKTELSNKEIIDLARKVISNIDEKYLDLYDSFVKNNSICIKKSALLDLTNNHKASYGRDIKKGISTQQIELYKQPDYTSVITLIHEFMHVTNFINDNIDEDPDDNHILRTEFTEFVSIYFELFAKDYLEKEFGIGNEKFGSSERFFSNVGTAYRDLIAFMPFYIFYKKGLVSHDNFIETMNNFKIAIFSSNSVYKMMLKEIIKTYDKSISFVKCYDLLKDKGETTKLYEDLSYALKFITIYENYIPATLLTFKARDSLTKKDIIDFNDLISSNGDYTEKVLSPEFKKVNDLYDRLAEDSEPYDNLSKYLELTFDEKGVLKKSYKL